MLGLWRVALISTRISPFLCLERWLACSRSFPEESSRGTLKPHFEWKTFPNWLARNQNFQKTLTHLVLLKTVNMGINWFETIHTLIPAINSLGEIYKMGPVCSVNLFDDAIFLSSQINSCTRSMFYHIFWQTNVKCFVRIENSSVFSELTKLVINVL